MLLRSLRRSALLITVALAAGCGEGARDGTAGEGGAEEGTKEPAGSIRLLDADPGLVLAEDRLGPITWADIDSLALELGPERRWRPASEPLTWVRDLARRVSLDRLIVEEAGLVGADQDPEFRRLERTILRNAYSNAHLATLPPEPAPSADDLGRLYDEQKDRFQRPERRQVLNIFKRWGDADAPR